jgi:hypothetical protein
MNNKQNKPWVAIVWFAAWGIFQTYAVVSVLNGSWERPEAFPEEAYYALIYPDIFFIPFYLLSSILLYRNHFLGKLSGLISGGAVIYVMIYLLALSGFKGVVNLTFDSLFLIVNILAVFQIIKFTDNKNT